MTVNQLIVIFRDIATRHKQVNSFKVSQDFNIDAEEQIHFPILVVNPTASELPKTENGYTSYSVSFDVQLIDLMNKDRDNEDDVISDTLTILKEIVNEFNTHPFYIDYSIDLVGNISFSPLRGVYDSDATGWRCTMELESPNKLSFCGSPIENITNYNFDAANVTVIDGLNTYELYPSDTYTCTPSAATYPSAELNRTGQTVSYTTGDDGDLEDGRDTDFLTLAINNPVGNTYRFTDELGGQTFANDIVIDWSSYDGVKALGWYRLKVATGVNWSDTIAQGLAATLGTFATWQMPNVVQWISILNFGIVSGTNKLNYVPFNNVNVDMFLSTTYNPVNSTIAAFAYSSGTSDTVGALVKSYTGSTGQLFCRNFTNAELGI